MLISPLNLLSIYSLKAKFYYKARGFSVYYFANAAWKIVRNSQSYRRGNEGLLENVQTLTLLRSFEQYPILHHFLSGIVRQVVEQGIGQLDEEEPGFLVVFLSTNAVPFTSADLKSNESFYDFTSEAGRYHDALDELTDEVFHILFSNVMFLESSTGCPQAMSKTAVSATGFAPAAGG